MKKATVLGFCLLLSAGILLALIYKNSNNYVADSAPYRAYLIKPGSILTIYFNKLLDPKDWNILSTDGFILSKNSKQLTVKFSEYPQDVPLIYKDGGRQIVLIFRLTEDVGPSDSDKVIFAGKEYTLLPASINFKNDLFLFTDS